MASSKGDDEPAPWGRKASFLVGCGIGVALLLVVGVLVAWRAKKAEDAKRARTVEALETDAYWLRELCESRPPRADGSGADWTGMKALVDNKRHVIDFAEWVVVDGWGNPIRYRCPGPIHKKGWDLWSCGPNGKDDQGTFDDILVGEDVATVSSG
jgi:hypothetical protein